MMKKTLALILALIMCLSLCACGNKGDSNNDEPEVEAEDSSKEAATDETTTKAPETETTEPSTEQIVYKLGDVIETDLFKITPSFTGYAYELANWPDENYMTPEGQFSGTSPYSAKNGNVMMYGEVKIEYIGNEKNNVVLDIGIAADYDNGYIYDSANNGFTTDSIKVQMGNCVSVDGDWDYDSNMTFVPLSSETGRTLRYCINVPEQVETNKDKSLLVTFRVNEEPFVFDFRSAEVRGSDYDPRGEFYQPIDAATKAQIVTYLKNNGLEKMGWYDKTVGVYTFTFGDSTVEATLPINSYYQYEFSGTYEVYSGTILLDWDYGEQMHLDYTFDGTNLEIIDFAHDR